jgi:predicted RND superfamily exporter protein
MTNELLFFMINIFQTYIIISVMKKASLVLFFTLFLASLSFAGGDDRDQQLPLNSLNTEQNIDEDATPRFLQEDDEIVQDEEIQQGQKEIEDLIQTKLVDLESSDTLNELAQNVDSASNGKVQILIDRYIKSDQGILIMLFLFVVTLILIFNFFVREK